MALLAAGLFPARIKQVRRLVWLENEFIALRRVLFDSCFDLSLPGQNLAWLHGIALNSAWLCLAGCRKKDALRLLLDRSLVLGVHHSRGWIALHFIVLVILPREIWLKSHLLILATLCVLLVHLVLILTHSLGLINAKLLALLVPAPLVDLTLRQASRL